MRYETQLEHVKEKYEQKITEGVSLYNWNIKAISKYCGIHRHTLNEYIRVLGLWRERTCRCPLCNEKMSVIGYMRYYCIDCNIEYGRGKAYRVTAQGTLIKLR